MTDDQQRARELRKQAAKILGDAYNAAHFFGAADDALSDTPSPHCQVTITAITAALRAAPVVPKARVTEPLRADESRQEQADNAIHNRGWNDCRAAMLTSSPAAPGIDLEQFRALVNLGMTYGPGSRYRVAAEGLCALIDASPKGGSAVVTDAMVHAALRVQYARAGSVWTGTEVNPDFVDMRHALTSAMQATSGEVGEN